LPSLKSRDHTTETDDLTRRLHAEAFRIIDCTRCANCCRTMTVVLTHSDVDRIAGHLGMATDAFINKYLEANESGEFVVRQKPCSFLGADGRCTIYDIRPTACQEFPHTDKGGFEFRTHQHSDNSVTCPAVYWIVEEMRKRLRSNRES
jgi:Fe-S-cluster containining protein